MIQNTCPYLNFAGDAADAIEFYVSALGAEVASLMRWSDMPGQDVPPALAKRVMHAELKIGGGQIMLSDAPPDWDLDVGNNSSVMVACTDPAELDRMFDALAEGGKVLMAVENTFWGARYGHVRDRFGVLWMFNCPLGE